MTFREDHPSCGSSQLEELSADVGKHLAPCNVPEKRRRQEWVAELTDSARTTGNFRNGSLLSFPLFRKGFYVVKLQRAWIARDLWVREAARKREAQAHSEASLVPSLTSGN